MSSTLAQRNEDTAGFGWWMFAAVLTLSDSLMSYFARTWTGSGLRVNALLPIFVVIALLAGGVRRVALPISYWICLLLGYGGFLIGLLTFGELNVNRFLTVTSGFAAFFVGYALATYLQQGRAETWSRCLFLIGSSYAVICALAVFHIAPALFPVIETFHFKNGLPLVRPEVTTDQNFQVFYLLPCVLPLLRGFRSLSALAALVASAISIAVLAQLQTRSGAIVFGLALVLALIAGYRRSKGKLQLLGIGVTAIAVVAVVWAGAIVRVAQPLIERFTTDDFSTFYGRLWSASYLLEHLIDPRWWIPRGNAEFQQLAGGEVPHFNGTAFFLEAGLLGFVCWLGVQIVPVIILGIRFARSRLSVGFEAIFVIGAAVIATSLSLNVPYVEVVWLWCGSMVAATALHAPATLRQFPLGNAENPMQTAGARSVGNLMS